jgi:hypothetical protein
MKIIDCIQGTPEWLEARRAKITGSRFKDVLARGNGITRTKYIEMLIKERRTGKVIKGYCDSNMEEGQKQEPAARLHYEKVNNVKVQEVGFIEHTGVDYLNYVGVSPDGLVGDDGGLEIKCPLLKNHKEYIKNNVLPSAHKAQVQGCMWVTERKWWDFVSYCENEEDVEKYWCVRVYRDQKYINELAAAVAVFIDEMVKLKEQSNDFNSGGCSDDEWRNKEINRVLGMCRNGLVQIYRRKAGFRKPLPDKIKQTINKDVEFVYWGK